MSGKLVDVSSSNIIIIIGHVFWFVASIRLTKSQSYQGVVFGSVSIKTQFRPIISLIGRYRSLIESQLEKKCPITLKVRGNVYFYAA